MADTKMCSRCLKTKPLDEFNKRAASPDGLAYWCKLCACEYRRRHDAEDVEWSREKARRYYARHREQARAQKRSVYAEVKVYQRGNQLQRKYGISLTGYDAMLKAQGGVCAICGRTPVEEGQRLCVDHNHETGKVRGLLCGRCNKAIGLFQDSPEVCCLAVLYLLSVE